MNLEPGPELDNLVHDAVNGSHTHKLQKVLPYSTDLAAAWTAVEWFFRGGEALHLQQDLDGKWIAGLMHWTNGGEYGPRIWDITVDRPAYKGLTAPHAISLAIGGYYEADGEEDCPFTEWEFNPMTDRVHGAEGPSAV